MSIHVVRWAEGRTVPWKNGGGETVEIAVSPDGASFDDFAWRISSALVVRSGPFSALPGIDRTLCITSDGAIELAVAGAPTLRLDRSSPPYRFSGDDAAQAMLLGEPVRDFNVMTRRGVCRHLVEALDLSGTRFVPVGADLVALFIVAGEMRVTSGGDVATLNQGDTLFADDAAARLGLAALSGPEDVRVILARFFGAGIALPGHGLDSAFPESGFAE